MLPATASAVFYVRTGGCVIAYNGTNETSLTTAPLVVSNEWTRFVTRLDYTTRKWDLWMNNTNIVWQYDFYSTSNSALARVRLEEYGNGMSYLDNVEIVGSAPSAMLPAVRFVTNGVTTAETGTTINVYALLSWAYSGTVTVSFAQTGGTAIRDRDYSLTDGMLVFDPGVTQAYFSVTILDDSYNETNETLVISLTDPTNAVLAPGEITFTCTIEDDDDAISVLPFVETFEDLNLGALDGQHGWSSVNWDVQTGSVLAGARAGGSTWTDSFLTNHMTQVFTNDAGYTNVLVEWNEKPSYRWVPENPALGTDDTAAVFINSNGCVVASSNTTWVTFTNAVVPTNCWAYFLMYMRYGDQQWDLSVNTNALSTNSSVMLVASNLAFVTNNASFTSFRVKTGPLDDMFIDSIHITTNRDLMRPEVNNADGATAVSYMSATLNGRLLTYSGVVSPDTDVYVYWGMSDGDTNKSAWAATNVVRSASAGLISFPVGGLNPGSNYYYRFYATNEWGDDWADSTTNFTTLPFIPAADTDGDGVSNTNEVLAGTDWLSANSYMRIISVDLSGSSNILVTMWLGTNHTFYVLSSDNATNAKTVRAAITTGATGGTNYWTDTNAVNATSQRFYSLCVRPGYTNTEEWAMFAQNRQTNGWYLASVPVRWATTNFNRMNSTLGTQLARGLTSGVDDVAADNVWLYNNEVWARRWLATTNVWKDEEDVPTSQEIKPGIGFWVKRWTNGLASTRTVFTGRPHTNSTSIVISENSWALLAWPFAKPRFESDGTGADQGWGFAAAGAKGSYSWNYADNLIGEYAGSWFSVYLGTNGRWYVRGTKNLANVALEPGRAYYYFHRGTGMVWKATEAP